MIRLFDEDEESFQNLGLGVLRDATSCTIKEELNGEYSLSMQYPINGSNFDKLVENRIIYTKPNPYDEEQPFRIYSISRPIGGTVSVTAYHISYDLNGVVCQPFKGGSLLDTLTKIQNNMDDTRFKFVNAHAVDDKYYRTYQITTPTNVKAILSADDDAVGGDDCYDCEFKYDKWTIKVYGHRGEDRGEEVRYAKNMTDLTQEVTTENLYSAVYPYYHKESTSEESDSTEDGFTKVWIVKNSKPYQDGWFSFEEDGDAYHPTSDSPVQVQTEGDFKDKVFTWDTQTQRYKERAYNESVTLISGITDPVWLKIDWSGFPTVKAVATVDGYFKSLTDSDWTKYKAGDSVYEGKITDIEGISGNMMLYFAEVIPSSSSSTTSEVSNITHVELDEKYLTTDDMTDAKSMKHKYVCLLDLTSEFDEEPSQEKLRAKAKEYIKENKLGKLKKSTDVSFVNLNATTDSENFKILKRVELGDTIRVLYTNLGVDEKLRVITTEYNALTNQYNSIELGEKKETLSDNSVQTGDNVSSLSNNAGYTNSSEVSKIIANTITADYIQAANAKLTKAQIEQLSVERIVISGCLEVSQFKIDELVASMLTAENAKIAQTLEAGTIKVAGDINIMSGEINLEGEDGTVFNVDREGQVTANAMTITGGSINIENSEGTATFEVTEDGYLSATGAKLTGEIIATAGKIGCLTITEEGTLQFTDINGDVIFKINGSDGSTTINKGSVGGISIEDKQIVVKNITKSEKEYTVFSVDNTGKLTATSGSIANFVISEIFDSDANPTRGSIYYNLDSIDDSKHTSGIYLGTDGIRLGDYPSDNDYYYTDIKNHNDYSGDLKTKNGYYKAGTYENISSTNPLIIGEKYSISASFNTRWAQVTVYDSSNNVLATFFPDDTFSISRHSVFSDYFTATEETVKILIEAVEDDDGNLPTTENLLSKLNIYHATAPEGFVVTTDGQLLVTKGYIGGASIEGGLLRINKASVNGIEAIEGTIGSIDIRENCITIVEHSKDDSNFTKVDVAYDTVDIFEDYFEDLKISYGDGTMANFDWASGNVDIEVLDPIFDSNGEYQNARGMILSPKKIGVYKAWWDRTIWPNHEPTSDAEAKDIYDRSYPELHYAYFDSSNGGVYANYGEIANFKIVDNSLYNGINTLESTSESGIYIGTDGLRLGANIKKDATTANESGFKVTPDGLLLANKGEIGGMTMQDNAIFSPSTFNTIDAVDTTVGIKDKICFATRGVYLGQDGFRLGINATRYLDYLEDHAHVTFIDINSITTPVDAVYGFELINDKTSGAYYKSQCPASVANFSYAVVQFSVPKDNMTVYMNLSAASDGSSCSFVISNIDTYLTYANNTSGDTSLKKSIWTPSNSTSIGGNGTYVELGSSIKKGNHFITIKFIKISTGSSYFGTINSLFGYDTSDYEDSIAYNKIEFKVEGNPYEIPFKVNDQYITRKSKKIDTHGYLFPERGGIRVDPNGKIDIVNGRLHGQAYLSEGSFGDIYFGKQIEHDTEIDNYKFVLYNKSGSDLTEIFYINGTEASNNYFNGVSKIAQYDKDGDAIDISSLATKNGYVSNTSLSNTLNDYLKISNFASTATSNNFYKISCGTVTLSEDEWHDITPSGASSIIGVVATSNDTDLSGKDYRNEQTNVKWTSSKAYVGNDGPSATFAYAVFYK